MKKLWVFEWNDKWNSYADGRPSPFSSLFFSQLALPNGRAGERKGRADGHWAPLRIENEKLMKMKFFELNWINFDWTMKQSSSKQRGNTTQFKSTNQIKNKIILFLICFVGWLNELFVAGLLSSSFINQSIFINHQHQSKTKSCLCWVDLVEWRELIWFMKEKSSPFFAKRNQSTSWNQKRKTLIFLLLIEWSVDFVGADCSPRLYWLRFARHMPPWASKEKNDWLIELPILKEQFK